MASIGFENELRAIQRRQKIRVGKASPRVQGMYHAPKGGGAAKVFKATQSKSSFYSGRGVGRVEAVPQRDWAANYRRMADARFMARHNIHSSFAASGSRLNGAKLSFAQRLRLKDIRNIQQGLVFRATNAKGLTRGQTFARNAAIAGTAFVVAGAVRGTIQQRGGPKAVYRQGLKKAGVAKISGNKSFVKLNNANVARYNAKMQRNSGKIMVRGRRAALKGVHRQVARRTQFKKGNVRLKTNVPGVVRRVKVRSAGGGRRRANRVRRDSRGRWAGSY